MSTQEVSRTPPKSFGKSPRRIEDQAILTGNGFYPSDARAEGMLQAFVLRSAMASARFTLGDLATARRAPGVAGILTHTDIKELGGLPVFHYVKNKDGSDHWAPPYPLLAGGVVRHIGEAIAFVVAETLDQAKSAAELIEVDYEPLPLVTEMTAAMAPGATLVWPEFKTNTLYDADYGDGKAVDAAMKAADRIIEITVINNRLVCNYMEPRSVLAIHDRLSGGFKVTLGSQGVHAVQRTLAGIFKLDPALLHVVTPDDVGGGFGTKNFVYREYPLAMAAARALSRPVFWQCERSEHFLADAHGRDNLATARLAVDKQGKFLGIDVDLRINMGAYLSEFGPAVPAFGIPMTPGLYSIPAVHARMRGVMTNSVPTDAYRGAGRPEAAYLIERLVDKAARELGLAPDDIRTRNFIKPAQLPYNNKIGRTYDSGEYEAHMRLAMEKYDWAGFAARREASEKSGKLRGIGMATYVEACASGSEKGRMELKPDGRIALFIGSQSNGQGHRTAFAQIASEELGVSIEDVEVVQGDTARVKTGGGTGGSKSVPLGAVIVNQASRRLADEIKKRAADELETSVGDIELKGGRAVVVGTDRAVTLEKIARGAIAKGEVIESNGAFKTGEFTYPNGTHICEIEIDRDTGQVAVVAYGVVDDFGVAVNPMLLAGQVRGGIVQGIGQALLERTVFDPETGQLLSGSFMDYALPRADDVVQIAFETRHVPGRSNPLGIKGAGEAGTIGAAPAVINAVVDALHHLNGTLHIDMPATPEVVWRAMTAARPA